MITFAKGFAVNSPMLDASSTLLKPEGSVPAASLNEGSIRAPMLAHARAARGFSRQGAAERAERRAVEQLIPRSSHPRLVMSGVTTMLGPRALGLLLLSVFAFGCDYKVPETEATASGEEIFQLCTHCHGEHAEGRREFNAPSIAGLPRWYIEAQLKKFRSGARGTHFNDLTGMEMRPMTLSFHNEGDLKVVAEYVASLPRPKTAPLLSGGDAAKGKTYFAPCTACHGPTGAGNEQVKAPPLRQASDWYLLAQ